MWDLSGIRNACVAAAHGHSDSHSSLSRTQCIVGVAGGATRAALTMHQARRNNMADVSAKDGSQVSSQNWRDGWGQASGQARVLG